MTLPWAPREVTWNGKTATYTRDEQLNAKLIMRELPEDEARAVLGIVHEAKALMPGTHLHGFEADT